jgi:hypothetical protein
VSGALSPEREREIRERHSRPLTASSDDVRDIRDLLAALDASRAERDACRHSLDQANGYLDELTTIVDEAFGLQPVQPADELLRTLERLLFERGQDYERWRAFAEAADAVAADLVGRCQAAEVSPGVLCDAPGKALKDPASGVEKLWKCDAHARAEYVEADPDAAAMVRAWLAAKAAVGR